jgi:hypothetical protein
MLGGTGLAVQQDRGTWLRQRAGSRRSTDLAQRIERAEAPVPRNGTSDRFFPMAGSTVTTLSMRLLSLMGVGSSTRRDAACMLVLGMGIGVSCRCWSSLCRTVCRTVNWADNPLLRHRLRSVYGRPLAGNPH